MRHPDRQVGRPKSRAYLHDAPGIPRHHHLRAGVCRLDCRDLAVEDHASHVRSEHGVDPRAAAAPVGAWQQPETQSGYCPQQREWSLVHSLGVLEMAGRIVRDVELQWGAGPGAAIGQQLGDVTNACSQPGGCVCSQQMAVVLEQRAASGAVHHYEIGLINQRFDVGRCERSRPFSVSRMLVQRSTADLTLRLHHSISIRLESSLRRYMDMPEQCIHDAAPEEGDRRGGRSERRRGGRRSGNTTLS